MHSSLSTLALLQLSTLASASIPTLSGWTLNFSDDFTGKAGALPDSTKWMLRTGTQYPGGQPNWGTGEVETYTASSANVGQSGQGGLWITPRKDGSGKWTSARVESKRADFQCKAGQRMRIQAGIQMPAVNTNNGKGYWPAFWAMGGAFRGNYNNWPSVGEWDIMENVNGANFAAQTMHCGTNPGGPCNESVGLTANGVCKNTACQGNWHTYAVIVDRKSSPESITFYVDGTATRVVRSTDMDATTWANAIHNGMFLVMNVGIGGAYANALNNNQYTPTAATQGGFPMKIDYVGVWYQ